VINSSNVLRMSLFSLTTELYFLNYKKMNELFWQMKVR
jgi:hypothetical protein